MLKHWIQTIEQGLRSGKWAQTLRRAKPVEDTMRLKENTLSKTTDQVVERMLNLKGM